MLWVIHHPDRYPDLVYRGGQGPIVHLEVDFGDAVDWAELEGLRWAFTTSNAASKNSRDYADRPSLSLIDWEIVNDPEWFTKYGGKGREKEVKQAEFLVERRFPWRLVCRIGVYSEGVAERVRWLLEGVAHAPDVEVHREWYH